MSDLIFLLIFLLWAYIFIRDGIRGIRKKEMLILKEDYFITHIEKISGRQANLFGYIYILIGLVGVFGAMSILMKFFTH